MHRLPTRRQPTLAHPSTEQPQPLHARSRQRNLVVLLIGALLLLTVPYHPIVGATLDLPTEPAGLTAQDWSGFRALIPQITAQQAYLKASNTGVGDVFGWNVAISGNTVVVGAQGEDSAATSVNGDGTNNAASDAGAAYVFVRSGTTWTQQAYLKASNPEADDRFGYSVAISGDTVVIGAYGEDSANNAALNAGAAYVFVRSGTTWVQQAYLQASNSEAGDNFGVSVAIAGDTVIVGAYQEDGAATDVNGNDDNAASQAGAAYVFTRSGTRWSQQAYLKASNTGAGELFGYSVAIANDTAVVGAYGEDSAATGVNSNQQNDSALGAGAAYVFGRSGTSWTQQAYLKASNTEADDGFGFSVAISADAIVAGAFGEDSAARSVNGNQDNGATDAGAAYVFRRSGTSWSQQAYLKASNTDAGDWFGRNVAIWGQRVAVGAYREDSDARGINGDQTNNAAESAGAVYTFTWSEIRWSQEAYLKASNTESEDLFGFSMALAGETLVVGANVEDSDATGVNGSQTNNDALSAGAVYIFDPNFPVLPATPTSTPEPMLHVYIPLISR